MGSTAEGVGFEPTVDRTADNGFRDRGACGARGRWSWSTSKVRSARVAAAFTFSARGRWRACHRVRGCEPGLHRGRRRRGARAKSQSGGYRTDVVGAPQGQREHRPRLDRPRHARGLQDRQGPAHPQRPPRAGHGSRTRQYTRQPQRRTLGPRRRRLSGRRLGLERSRTRRARRGASATHIAARSANPPVMA
jgi:hypothetical protein